MNDDIMKESDDEVDDIKSCKKDADDSDNEPDEDAEVSIHS